MITDYLYGTHQRPVAVITAAYMVMRDGDGYNPLLQISLGWWSWLLIALIFHSHL